MRNRLFAVVALAILISQPVILTSSIAIIPAADISNSKLIITAQDHGTRLAPSEHTNHVAILINGSDDFTSQGWPGAGTENNPFVISGLNITYDIDIPLIRIFNVDDYFVIEDCFVNQLSSYYAIHLENVTNAMIRYTTAISPYGSVICVNADGTTAENLLLVSGNKYGLYITNSESFDLTRSLVNTSSYNGVYLNGSAQSSISDSIIDSANPYFDIEIRYSNNVTVTDTEFHAAAIEVYIYRCAYFYGDGITSGEGTIGMYLYQSNDTEIVNADITSTDEALYSYSCLGLSISDSIFSSPTYIQETMDFTLCDNVLLDNIHLNNTGGDGIRLTQTNATIQNSLFTYIGDNAIELSQSHDTKIFSNTFEHIYNDAIYMSQSHRANVTGNIADDLGRFIVPQSSDNGTIYMNEIVDANAGVASWDCEGWEVYGNTISEVISGISVSLGAFFDVWENTITEASGAGIQTDTHGLFEAWENTITSCADIGISHVDSDSVYDRDNIITDCDAG
ncbi:MAG: right-handed parallel beta-helix repeat-containing protein, partial [Candidatus Thorarchaeota archaeon]